MSWASGLTFPIHPRVLPGHQAAVIDDGLGGQKVPIARAFLLVLRSRVLGIRQSRSVSGSDNQRIGD